MIKLQIERYQFDRTGLKAKQASIFVTCLDHGEALCLETLSQHMADFRFVIDDCYVNRIRQVLHPLAEGPDEL